MACRTLAWTDGALRIGPAAGTSSDQILNLYPSLEEADINEALTYAASGGEELGPAYAPDTVIMEGARVLP
jgi:Protein of unknown function (DUF433)